MKPGKLLIYRGAVYQLADDSAPEQQTVSLTTRVIALRGQLAQAAQKEYDAWQQDEEGVDEELGCGGACDRIAEEMGDVLSANGINILSDQDEGGDHAYLFAYDDVTKEIVIVDIPPGVYETGGGYRWSKRPGITISADDVVVEPLTDVSLDALLTDR